MKLRDPCKKCIVRACCTLVCEDKAKRTHRIYLLKLNYKYTKQSIKDAFSWFKKEWPVLFGLSVIVVEIFLIIYMTVLIVIK